MNSWKKILIRIAFALALLYTAACCLLFFEQEKLIFHPKKLPADYSFSYPGRFREIKIPSFDGKKLDGLLFSADSSKGLVFYLHGNAGALNTWGEIAGIYTALNYDIFIWDYRGFGKSEGNICSDEQFHLDVQAAYDFLKREYPENRIVVIGYSIGTGPAARLAAANHPKLLILQAPYYSLPDLVKQGHPSLTPGFLLKYKFNTFEFLQKTVAPVAIFHGDSDRTIYYGSSVK